VVLTGWRPRRLGLAKAVSRQNGARDEDAARITQEDQAWDQTNDLMAHLASTGQNHCAEVLEPTFFKAAPDAEELIAFFAAKMSSPESHILIASIAAEPAGYVWFDVQDRPDTPLTLPRRRIYIHHLSVQAGARRQSLATMLMKHVEDKALALGIRTIALDTWAANSSARSFFSGRGFEPFNVSLNRQLP